MTERPTPSFGPNRVRERTALACRWLGALLLAGWLAGSLSSAVLSRLELQRFQGNHAETAGWAPGRVTAYRKALRVALPVPEAVLRLPAAHIEVPVLEGTSAMVLNRAAGHLSGTALPGSLSNIVIAGHRDGFFRRLKNVSLGDTVELARAGGVDVYRVDRLAVVERTDTAALQPTHTPTLTLITCYPFFYLGAAPQRYVVRASLVAPAMGSHS